MAKIHMTLQGKGGVGKSLISTITAQYKIHNHITPLCIDTDPVNDTFHGFKKLAVKRLEIMQKDEINARCFDTLIEMIAETKSDVIIDNGASSFVPLSHYLVTNEVPSLLKDMRHELLIHTIITGGQALVDTVSGFSQLIRQFSKEAQFIVWLNPYWGDISAEGKSFEQMKAYKDNLERVSAVIYMPVLKQETYGRDISDMLQERLTFDEAIASPDKTIMTRQRLKIIKDTLFNQLDKAVVI